MGSRAGVGLALVVACTASGCDLPITGDALVVVETDMPHALGDRLRVDLFREDGKWYATREFSLPGDADWPASFGLVADVQPRTVYARLRLYPQGLVRDYRGERFVGNDPVSETPFATNLTEMCANPQALHIGERVTLRRAGVNQFTQFACGAPAQFGAAAAIIDVPEDGQYTIGALGTTPNAITFSDQTWPFYDRQVTLELRTSCATGSFACDPGGLYNGTRAPPRATGQPLITTHLAKGEKVWVVVGGDRPGQWAPTDVVVGATREGEWPPPVPSEPPPIAIPLEGSTPPDAEPLPTVTIDRLVALRVAPGEHARWNVVLRGACVGRMAFLGSSGFSPTDARSCIDGYSSVFAPIATPMDALATTAFGAPADCPMDLPDDRKCIPGGAGILGSQGPSWSASIAPLRTYAVSTFLLDRTEVAVSDFRKWFAPRKSKFPPNAVLPNNANANECTYTPTANAKFDRLPMVCLTWNVAREYCRAQGGDLPTEAQWEHAATVAGRPAKTRYPWGNDPPQCACGDDRPCHAPIFGHYQTGGSNPALVCSNDLSPSAVDAAADLNTGDASPQQVIGLAGNVSELLRDALGPYDGPCLRAAGAIDPVCDEEQAPLRVTHAGYYGDAFYSLGGSIRREQPPTPFIGVGFRCAYPVSP